MNHDSADRAISGAILRLIFFVLLAKAVGALKEIALASYYGVGPLTDAFLLNVAVANTLAAVWLGMLTLIVVPLLARQRTQPASDAQLFREELVGWTVLVSGGLALAYGFIMPVMVKLPGLPASTASLAADQAIFFSVLVPIGLLSALATCFLLASGRHISSLAEGVPALVLLTFIIVTGGRDFALTWGTVLGWSAHLVLLIALLRWTGQWPRARWSRRSTHWEPLWTAVGVLAVGHTLASCSEVVDNFFAAGLGEGAISLLSYANRLLGIATGLGATIIARATLPIFSDTYASRPMHYRFLVWKWATVAAAIGTAALILGWQLAPWAVRIFLERGAFDAADSLRVTQLLRMALLQLPAYFPGVVLAGGLAAAGAYRAIGAIAALNLVVKIAANTLLIERHGLAGIPISTAIMYGSATACCFVALHVSTRNLTK